MLSSIPSTEHCFRGLNDDCVRGDPHGSVTSTASEILFTTHSTIRSLFGPHGNFDVNNMFQLIHLHKFFLWKISRRQEHCVVDNQHRCALSELFPQNQVH